MRKRLIFDDSNLFRVNKFAGWDRVEGGGRANYGVQYTAQFNRAGSVNVLFGESYQLFGTNSFAAADLTNTGLDSGLDTRRSDYVSRLTYQPNSIYAFSSRFRFDKDTYQVKRMELEAAGAFRPLERQHPLRRLCGAAGYRLPDPPLGHPDLRLGQTGDQLAAFRRRAL